MLEFKEQLPRISLPLLACGFLEIKLLSSSLVASTFTHETIFPVLENSFLKMACQQNVPIMGILEAEAYLTYSRESGKYMVQINNGHCQD